jgi:hypothetical protein
MRIFQNEQNMLPKFPAMSETSQTDNNALDLDAIYNLKLRKT